MQVATSSLIQDLPVSQSYINGAWVDTQAQPVWMLSTRLMNQC